MKYMHIMVSQLVSQTCSVNTIIHAGASSYGCNNCQHSMSNFASCYRLVAILSTKSSTRCRIWTFTPPFTFVHAPLDLNQKPKTPNPASCFAKPSGSGPCGNRMAHLGAWVRLGLRVSGLRQSLGCRARAQS